jgi:hypothetical protein
MHKIVVNNKSGSFVKIVNCNRGAVAFLKAGIFVACSITSENTTEISLD